MMGERLGKWTLSTELGRGGMGRVYLAVEDVTGRQAAVKILSTELAADPGFLGRFEREIEALSQLSHPHIVQFYEAGNDAGKYYYAMEYVPGESLDDVIKGHGRLQWRQALEVALQICPALKHVHDHGIVHRDIKLANILIRDDGIVKLTDFGIAKVFATTDLTKTGGVVGTPEYISPEQAQGKPATKKSDIYSLGVVFYYMLTGRPPFEGAGALDLMHKHRYAQFDRPAKVAANLPYELDELVCHMLEKDPAKRPPDCLVLAKQLDAIRMKLERKEQSTQISEGDTIAQTRAFNREAPGPITLAERLGHTGGSESGPIGRAFNNPIVLGALLLLCLGTIAYAFWPMSQESLFQKGSELMASDRLADQESAWTDYLDPLQRRYPDNPYQAELERYRGKLEASRHPGEAWRFLAVADKRMESGDAAGAAELWGNVIAAFAASDDDKDAVAQARKRLADAESPKTQNEKLRRVKPILDHADSLLKQGQRDEAERIWTSLQALYANDPGGRAIVEAIRRQRGK